VYCDYYYCYGDLGLWDGGVAMCCLGGATTIAWFVLLVLYLIRRRKREAWNPDTRFVENQTSTVSAPVTLPPPTHNYSPPSNAKDGARFCGQCGTSVQTPFCPTCGASV
jgi:hypothetical protein